MTNKLNKNKITRQFYNYMLLCPKINVYIKI